MQPAEKLAESGVHHIPKKKRRPRVTGGRQRDPRGFLDKVLLAADPRNRLACIIAAVFGGALPALTFFEAHLGNADMPQIATALFTGGNCTLSASFWLAAGGMLVSSIKVYGTTLEAFGERGAELISRALSHAQAAGTVVLLEGTLTFSPVKAFGVPWLSVAALVLLMGINAVARAAKLAMERTF